MENGKRMEDGERHVNGEGLENGERQENGEGLENRRLKNRRTQHKVGVERQ